VLWCSGQVRMTHVGGITLCNFQYRQKYEIYMLGSLSVVQWSKYFFLIFLIFFVFFVFLCWRPMTDMNLTLFRSVWFSGGAQERQALELFQTTDNATTRAAAHHLIGLACEQVDTVLNAMRRNATYVKSLWSMLVVVVMQLPVPITLCKLQARINFDCWIYTSILIFLYFSFRFEYN